MKMGKGMNIYVGTFSWETPSRLLEDASGH